MTIYWALLFFTGTKGQTINYIWQVLLCGLSVTYGVLGLVAAKHWNWLKSNVGQGIFAISLGVIVWGIGQGIWTYYVISNPGEEAPTSRLIDLFYMTSIPLWIYGILRLSKATGARYALKKPVAKVGTIITTLLLLGASYYLLVEVARGGSAYFTDATPMDVFVDLGYAAGDAVNLILVVVIFGLSWKLLGGMFRRPILVILFSFVSIYLADMFYSYRTAQEVYYNGDISDLFYLLTIASFGIGLSMLDPITRKAATLTAKQTPATEPAVPIEATAPTPQTAQQADPVTPETAVDVAEPVVATNSQVEIASQQPVSAPEPLSVPVEPAAQQAAAPQPPASQAPAQESAVPLPQANTVISPTPASSEPEAQAQQNQNQEVQ